MARFVYTGHDFIFPRFDVFYLLRISLRNLRWLAVFRTLAVLLNGRNRTLHNDGLQLHLLRLMLLLSFIIVALFDLSQ